MGWARDQFHEECVEQRRVELERDGYSYREARRLADEQIIHDHDPRDLDPGK